MLFRSATLSSAGFKAFFRDNSFWLRPYAAFCSLRDRFGTADFSCWEEHSFYDESAIADYCAVWSPWYKSVALYYYIQYHLHVQLSEVKEYAHRAGVVLKGDIPIGISRTSVDAWVNPQLFHMDSQAGAWFSTNSRCFSLFSACCIFWLRWATSFSKIGRAHV